MSTDLKAFHRQLKIKTGVVKRQIKELSLYRQEEQENVQKVEKLKAAGADGADIRHAETVLKEAQKMVPDAQERTKKAVDDLRDLLNQAMSKPELAEDEDVKDAKSALAEAEL